MELRGVIDIFPLCGKIYRYTKNKEAISMEQLKKFFPWSFKALDVKALVIAIIIYVVIGFIGGLIIGLLALIPVIGLLAGIVGALLEIYTLAGIILAILVFAKVLK